MAHPRAKMKRGDIETIVDRVQCVICTAIQEHLVAMQPKPNMVDKHACKGQAKIDLPYVGIKKKNQYYINRKMPPLEGNYNHQLQIAKLANHS